MKKFILLGLLTLLTFTYAKMIDGIAIIVEGELITTAEIYAVQKQMNVSKEQASNLLIQDRLQQAVMKDIDVDEKDIDIQIAKIAAQNNLTIPQMQKILQKKAVSWNKYRLSIKKAMKKEKFYKEKVISSIPSASEDQLKLFYRNHQKEFTIPSMIKMIEYSALTKKQIKSFLQTKNKKGIKSLSVNKSTKDLNPTLLATLLQTKNGSFTRPFNAGDRYISYKIIDKKGRVNMPFEAAKRAVDVRWRQQQQGKALKDYFEKLKTNATIQRLR